MWKCAEKNRKARFSTSAPHVVPTLSCSGLQNVHPVWSWLSSTDNLNYLDRVAMAEYDLFVIAFGENVLVVFDNNGTGRDAFNRKECSKGGALGEGLLNAVDRACDCRFHDDKKPARGGHGRVPAGSLRWNYPDQVRGLARWPLSPRWTPLRREV